MFSLLAYPIIILLTNISITFSETDFAEYIIGKNFIQDIIDGKKPTGRPEAMIFTAPFKICNGECQSNETNFIMYFPIHVGLKRSQTVHKSFYPNDKGRNGPFMKSTTRDPYTLCPTTTSDEELKPPTIRPGCSFRVSKYILIMLSSICYKSQATLPWERWSWSMPQAPIERFFRRYESNIMPIRSPSVQCECPPNKECNLEYEINKDIIYFQNLKGIIKDKELKQRNEDFSEKEYRKNNYNETVILRRRKLLSDIILDSKELTKDCCCPMKSVVIPAFITDKKFDEVIERLNRKRL